ncbi:hypothetical protein P1X15_22645 [Runella sp. MFBS21]|uniref:hypothetical protein n=1 Tax=Runella sp. MFBS21 TaxID=3034018 RepID=UPI0023F9A709|nr:hypothetical protein [Runella sp. MFBS21]MDF7820439.1 hypothetical protein [Runella sp. MFBS21]
MNLIDRIKNYFSRENFKSDPELVSFSDLEPPQSPLSASVVKSVGAFTPPTTVSTPTDSTVIPSSISSMPTERSEYLEETPAETKSWVFTPPATPVEWPAWLEDETLLRDEGVIFGLSESKPEEKVAIIKNYFVHQTAGLEREVERHGEKIQELNLFIEQKENRINELKEKTYQLENRRPEGEHYLLRTVVGTIFSIAMCVGNYFLIDDTLRPLYPNSQWIAIGVFLAGMFNLFGRVSFFHDTDSPVSWRRGLEEVGMPFAAALFVFVQALQNQNLVRAGALFVFVFFLFLFAGKLLLSNMTVLRNDLRIWLTGSSLKKEKMSKTDTWDAEINRLTSEIDELRVQKWQILPHLNRAEAELARVNARRDALIKMFESEFNLARQLRERLSDRQVRDIHSSINRGQ